MSSSSPSNFNLLKYSQSFLNEKESPCLRDLTEKCHTLTQY